MRQKGTVKIAHFCHQHNVRVNYVQKGKDDGGLSMAHSLDIQNYQGSLDSGTKVEGMVQAWLSQRSSLLGLEPMHKLNFMHLIS